ncbi:MAG: hypothetical protein GXO45_01415, partial [Aquificae bacterium]|nr:hypothetical protein [Aquificota bacterium]
MLNLRGQVFRMKKWLALTVSALILAGCNEGNQTTKTNPIYATASLDIKQDIKRYTTILAERIVDTQGETKEDKLFKTALMDIRQFLQGKEIPKERVLKALKYIQIYTQKRNYKPLSQEDYQNLKDIILYL